MPFQDQRSLRTRLRDDLSHVHERLDSRLSLADLTTGQGLRRFLFAQSFGFRQVMARLDDQDPPATAPLLSRIAEALDADLATLDAPDARDVAGQGARPEADEPPLSGLAIDYMVLGSGLGTTVLRRSWAEGTDDDVRAAGQYFTLPRPPQPWRDLVMHLGDLPASGDRADRITGDAEQIFEFFATGWDRSGDIRVRTASAPKGDATRDPTNP